MGVNMGIGVTELVILGGLCLVILTVVALVAVLIIRRQRPG